MPAVLSDQIPLSPLVETVGYERGNGVVPGGFGSGKPCTGVAPFAGTTGSTCRFSEPKCVSLTPYVPCTHTPAVNSSQSAAGAHVTPPSVEKAVMAIAGTGK